MLADTSTRRRPVIVTLLAVVCFLSMIYLAYLGYDTWVYARLTSTSFADAQVRTGLLRAVLLGPILGVLGVGLWQMRRWARGLAVVLLLLTIGSTFAGSFARYPVRIGLLVGINRSIIPAALLLFFLHPATKALFEARRGARSRPKPWGAGRD